MYVPDNYDAFDAWDAEQSKRAAMYPVCEYCSRAIQDDYFFVINDESICEECLNQHFRRNTDDYIE